MNAINNIKNNKVNAIIDNIDGSSHDWMITTTTGKIVTIKSECGLTDYPVQLFIDGHLHKRLIINSDNATYIKA